VIPNQFVLPRLVQHSKTAEKIVILKAGQSCNGRKENSLCAQPYLLFAGLIESIDRRGQCLIVESESSASVLTEYYYEAREVASSSRKSSSVLSSNISGNHGAAEIESFQGRL
jgi:hypothetical protein